MTEQYKQESSESSRTTDEQPLIVVSSRTGNTMLLAQTLHDVFGGLLVRTDAIPEDLSSFNPVMLGFWCDRGMAPDDMKAAARRMSGKRIGCFATLGGDPGTQKAKDWMAEVSNSLVESGMGNTLECTFLCRGRIDPKLFDAMSKKLQAELPMEEAQKAARAREARRLASEHHPDRADLENVVEAFRQLFSPER